jgi:hypothetical protein
MAWLLRQKNANVRRVRTDNGGEYMGKEFTSICSKLGIIHETTSPYTPEHNGIAERYNRTLQEGALTLQHDSDLSSKFWVSAIHTVNFVKNRVLHHRLGISPYKAFWEKKPSIDWLRTYGCKCCALVPKAVRRKGQYKSVEGIFIGYFDDSKAYKVWVPRTHTILKARDMIFDESNRIERTTIHATDDDDTPYLWTKDSHISITQSVPPIHGDEWTDDQELPLHIKGGEEAEGQVGTEESEAGKEKGKEKETVEEQGSEEGGQSPQHQMTSRGDHGSILTTSPTERGNVRRQCMSKCQP